MYLMNLQTINLEHTNHETHTQRLTRLFQYLCLSQKDHTLAWKLHVKSIANMHCFETCGRCMQTHAEHMRVLNTTFVFSTLLFTFDETFCILTERSDNQWANDYFLHCVWCVHIWTPSRFQSRVRFESIWPHCMAIRTGHGHAQGQNRSNRNNVASPEFFANTKE